VVAEEVPEAPRTDRPVRDDRDGGSAQDLLVRAARELAENRVDAARRLVEAAREADPSEPAVYALEGFVHDLAGRTDEAVAAYRAALYLDPGLYQPRLLLADCLARLGNRSRAEHEFRQVLAGLARGGARELVLLEELPLPGRERAERVCRQALRRR
jgi:chemotaxis protein methyltransferase CheR